MARESRSNAEFEKPLRPPKRPNFGTEDENFEPRNFTGRSSDEVEQELAAEEDSSLVDGKEPSSNLQKTFTPKNNLNGRSSENDTGSISVRGELRPNEKLNANGNLDKTSLVKERVLAENKEVQAEPKTEDRNKDKVEKLIGFISEAENLGDEEFISNLNEVNRERLEKLFDQTFEGVKLDNPVRLALHDRIVGINRRARVLNREKGLQAKEVKEKVPPKIKAADREQEKKPDPKEPIKPSEKTPDKSVTLEFLQNKLRRLEDMTGPELLALDSKEFDQLSSLGQAFFGQSGKNIESQADFVNRLETQRNVANTLRRQALGKKQKVEKGEKSNINLDSKPEKIPSVSTEDMPLEGSRILGERAEEIYSNSNLVDKSVDELVGRREKELNEAKKQEGITGDKVEKEPTADHIVPERGKEYGKTDFEYNRIQKLLDELEPSPGLDKFGRKCYERYKQLGFKKRMAASLVLLGAGTMVGGVLGGGILLGRRLITTSAAAFGAYDAISLLRDRSFSQKLQKSIEELGEGPVAEGALGQGKRESKTDQLEKIDDLLAKALVRGGYSGKNETDLRQDSSIQKLLEIRDQIETFNLGPEDRLKQWSDNADGRLEKYFVSEGRKRKVIKGAAVGVSVLGQFAASYVMEKFSNAVGSGTIVSTENTPSASVEETFNQEPTHPQALPPENPALARSVDGIKLPNIKPEFPINSEVLQATSLEENPISEKVFKVGNGGVIGALKDLKGSEPESYSKMMDQLRGIYTSDAAGANNHDDAILTRFALDYEKSHFGDLDRISHASIRLSTEGMPTLENVDYLPEAPADIPLSESVKDLNKPDIQLSGPRPLDATMQTPELEVPKPPTPETLPSAAETVSLDHGEEAVAETPKRSTIMDKHLENLENDPPEQAKSASKSSGTTTSKKFGFWGKLLRGILLGGRRN